MTHVPAQRPALMDYIGAKILAGDAVTLRFLCLAAAIVIYAAVGSPTPDNPGQTEIVLAVLLGAAALPQAVRMALSRLWLAEAPLWKSAGYLFLLYGLSVPSLMAAAQGNPLSLILRDLAPFLFFLLPLFLGDMFIRWPQFFHALLALAVFAGLAFAFRSIPQLAQSHADPLAYLANAPTVLFAALALTGLGARKFLQKPNLKNMLAGFACAGLALLPLCAMAMVLQRASLGYFAVFTGIGVAMALYRYPSRTLPLLILAALCFLPFAEMAAGVTEALFQKTRQTGLNMRAQEMAAVWDAVSANPLTLLFGGGWGATFNSPAVGEMRVNFTHSLLSSMVLKTGLAGLALAIFYLYGLAREMLAILRRDTVLGLALAGPFLINIFLYASFKSLDFGLFLLVLTAGAEFLRRREIASEARLLYSD